MIVYRFFFRCEIKLQLVPVMHSGAGGAGASCPRLSRRQREDMWASGFRQTSDFEMNIRRGVGVALFVLALGAAQWLRGYDGGWRVQYTNDLHQGGGGEPDWKTFGKSALLCSLSGVLSCSGRWRKPSDACHAALEPRRERQAQHSRPPAASRAGTISPYFAACRIGHWPCVAYYRRIGIAASERCPWSMEFCLDGHRDDCRARRHAVCLSAADSRMDPLI